MIDRATVDRIIDAAQIVDVVSDFVTLRKAGVNYKGLCPFHDDRTPSFVVSPSKGLCKCFACGKGGNAVHFIMEHEQLSYPDALRYLAKKYNIEIKERELSDEEKQAQSERESMFIVNEWACQFFQDQLSNTVDGRAIGMAYFRSRGFRDDIIKKFQLGYSPSQRDALAKEAKAKGYKQDYLLSTGLCYKRDNGQLQDRFFGRVIFPVHTLSGKVVAFGGRVLDAATKGVSVKYQNSPESSIYSKKKELYGLFQAKQAIVKQDLCFLVEGYTDVISMHQMGVENVVSSSGTALTNDQIRMIHRFTDNITVLYDGDAAGIKASERGIDMLLAEGMNVKLLLLPDGEDPDSFARKHNATEYQAYLNDHQTDFIKFKTDLLLKEAQGDPIKLSRLINSIVHSISVIPDEITRSVYVKQSALMLGLEERTLAVAIAKEITKAKEEKQKQKGREQNIPTRNEEIPSPVPVPDINNIPQDNAVPFPVTEDIPALSENDIPGAYPDIATITAADIPAEPQVPTENTYLPQQQTNDMTFYRKELLLMQVLIRHGNKVMCYTEDEKPLSVAEYIHYALKEDDIKLHTQLHTTILEEAMAHIQEEGFSTERFFLNHSDNRISMLAFELCDDKYQLSKYHTRGQKIASEEERLMELVPHLIDDFKLAIIKEELKQILLQLRNPAILSNQEEYMRIMKHYKELKDIECILSKERGDRVIS